MRPQLDNIGHVLESVLTGLEMSARTRECMALVLWSEVVGEQVDRITAVQSVRGGVLHVDVESSVWAQELHFYKPDMIARLNRAVGADAIQDIHFRVRTILKRPREIGGASRPGRGPLPDIQLTLDECREIDEIAGRVNETEIREAITSTMTSYRRLERSMTASGWNRCARCQALFRRKRGCPFCAF